MKRSAKLAVILVFCILIGIPMGVVGASDGGEVVFATSEVKSDGLFTLRMTISDVTFNAFQFALRYDPKEIQASTAQGTPATDFAAFSQKTDSGWMATIGTKLDAKNGMFQFCGYVNPGAEGSKGGSLTADAKGLTTFTFQFKKLGTKPVQFWLATEKEGEPYDHSLPNGGGLVDVGRDVPARLSFNYPKEVGKNETNEVPKVDAVGTESRPTTPVPTQTKQERLKDTVILQIGNSAASIAGTRCAIYPNEPAVSPYIRTDRTFVPIRFIAERLGAVVTWDNATQTATIKQGVTTVVMTVGKREYTVDGAKKAMDVPAEFMGNPENRRTMVPIRFVAESLQKDVQWDQQSNAVIISPKNDPWNPSGTLEKEILSDTLLMLSPLVQGFVQQ